MTTQQGIIRAIGVAVASAVAVLVGLCIRQVVIDGGTYNPGLYEPIAAAIIGAVIGLFAPSAEQRKKTREKLLKK